VNATSEAARRHRRLPDVSPRQSLLLAVATVAFGFLGSRILGVVRTSVIASEFGTSADLDAYFVAFRIPDLIFQVLAGATLGSAFIPVFARLWLDKGHEEAWRLASAVTNLVGLATVVLALFALATAPWLVPLFAPGLGEGAADPQAVEDLAVKLTRWMLISPILFALSGMVMATLNARHQFFLPALAPMLYNLAIIGGALLLADDMGVEGLAIGAIVGSGLHLLVQLPGLVRERMAYSLVLLWQDARVREVMRLMGPRVIGLAAVQLNFLIITFFASDLGPSYISALNYAWLLAQLPLGLFGVAISTAVFPMLAEYAARAEVEEFRRRTAQSLRFILFLTIPAAVGLLALSEPVVGVLLQRGEFELRDTDITAGALMFFAIGLPAQGAIEILSRGFYAVGDTRTPVALAVGSMLGTLLLGLLFVEVWELRGLALAVSLASTLEALGLFWFLAGRIGSGIGEGLGDTLLRSAIASAAMGSFVFLAAWGVDQAMPASLDDGFAEYVAMAVVGVAAGLGIFAACAGLMESPEVEMAMGRVNAVRQRFRRR
jgi:putative peptidoglycan lipid II flippase